MSAEHSGERVRVLFIDDEARRPLSHASDCLQELYAQAEGFLVTVCTSMKEATDHISLARKGGTEDVVVLDIMMPVAETVADETLDPLSVGSYILKQHLRNTQSPYLRVPVLILTNRDQAEVQKLVEGVGRTWVRQKSNLPSFHLPRFLKEEIVGKLKDAT